MNLDPPHAAGGSLVSVESLKFRTKPWPMHPEATQKFEAQQPSGPVGVNIPETDNTK